jgi:hypothetical protein
MGKQIGVLLLAVCAAGAIGAAAERQVTVGQFEEALERIGALERQCLMFDVRVKALEAKLAPPVLPQRPAAAVRQQAQIICDMGGFRLRWLRPMVNPDGHLVVFASVAHGGGHKYAELVLRVGAVDANGKRLEDVVRLADVMPGDIRDFSVDLGMAPVEAISIWRTEWLRNESKRQG